VLGATWLQEAGRLWSRGIIAIGPLVSPPEPFAVTVVASSALPELDAPVAPTRLDRVEMVPRRETPRANARLETVASDTRDGDIRFPETTAPVVPVQAANLSTPPAVVHRPVPELSGPIAPVSSATSLPLPPPAPAPTPAAPTPPTAAPPPAAPASASAVSTPSDELLVKQVLQRYRNAYEGLDARSARAVWPAVNENALARAFDGLESQRLTFEACDVRLRGEAAAAICHGSARYVPKVGSHEPRVEPRTWNFTLRKNGSDWTIESARAER
jgi:hypothetical protein